MQTTTTIRRLDPKWKCPEAGCLWETDWPPAIGRHSGAHKAHARGEKAPGGHGRGYRKPAAAAVLAPSAPPATTGGSKAWESSLQWWDLPDLARKWTPNEIRKLMRGEAPMPVPGVDLPALRKHMRNEIALMEKENQGALRALIQAEVRATLRAMLKAVDQ